MKKSKEVMTLKLSIYFVGEGEGRHKTGYGRVRGMSGRVQLLDLGSYKGVHLKIALQILKNK